MGKAILVVYDFAMNLRFVNDILSEFYDVHICKDGLKALKILKEIHIDLILLDIIMPEMSGTDFLKIVKQVDDFKDIPVIIMTGRKDLETFRSAYKYGIADFIGKPFDKNTLLSKVSCILERKCSDEIVK